MTTLTHPVSLGHGAGHHPLRTLLKVVAAFREALSAQRTYEIQRARGATHTDALSRAFKAGYNT